MLKEKRREGFYWVLKRQYEGDTRGEWIVARWGKWDFGRKQGWIIPGSGTVLKDDFFMDIGEEVLR